MAGAGTWTAWRRRIFGPRESSRQLALEAWCHRYVREKQQAMRYVQHAEKMKYPQFRDALRRLAAEEEAHAKMIAAEISKLGGKLPEVVPIHVPHEPNSWYYLRTDLEEERRCAGEIEAALPTLRRDYPRVAELLDRIERDGRHHRAKVRDMLARSDPQAADRA